MGKTKSTAKKPRQSIDDLFSEFVHEMNQFSTNGLIRDVDQDRVVELAGHFLSQCDSREDRNLLEEQILLLLSAKYNYHLLEDQLRLSERVETSVREAIQRICRKYFKDATRFAGLALNWSVIKPYKIFRASLEPAIANTVLTYSIAVQAPHLDRVDLQTRLVEESAGSAIHEEISPLHRAGLYSELEQVRQYSDEDLNGLVATVRDGKESKMPASNKAAVSEAHKLTHDGGAIRGKVLVDLEPVPNGRTEKKSTDLVRIEKSLVSEVRPIGAVQEVISQHELKIFNSYKLAQNKSQVKHGRVSVRFSITTHGTTKEVAVLHNSFSEDLATRIANQIKYFRFSAVDAKLGDQTVYHTFYF